MLLSKPDRPSLYPTDWVSFLVYLNSFSHIEFGERSLQLIYTFLLVFQML
jgi:hypothetical protein